MEIQVIIKSILAPVKFQKKDGSGEIVKYSFVAETSGQYPKLVKFDVMGRQAETVMQNVVVGQPCTVSFDVQSRPWKETFITTCDAWKVVGASGVQSQQQQQVSNTQTQTQTQTSVDSETDLPF